METITGFHACSRDFAERLKAGEISLDQWQHSTNPYDWLGSGIYFWEASRRRANEWAAEFVRGEAAVVEADIELGRCLDLTETAYLDLIRETYESLVDLYGQEGWILPENREIPALKGLRREARELLDRVNRYLYEQVVGIKFERYREAKLRDLDCLVINQFLNLMESGMGDESIDFQTVRCPFEEGGLVFPGSMIRRQHHVQVSVRDHSCIRILDVHQSN